ncbi:MAG: MerR family transcriptional regulator [Chloroflexi bacterium]|nr:MerR family transcriptional regulator [Chloroflexota bacterium]
MVQRDRRVNQQREEQRQEAVEPIPIKARPDDLALEPRGQNPRKGSHSGDQEVQGVYIISVAARLLEMHPQTLRKYERLGLVSPSRTVGMLRLYSDEDLEKLRLIRYIETNLGMNLAGVEFILNLLEQLLEMHQRISLHDRVQAMDAIMEREMKRLFKQLNLPFNI